MRRAVSRLRWSPLPADGTGQREAWRRFLHGSVSPVARIVQGELRAKLDDTGAVARLHGAVRG